MNKSKFIAKVGDLCVACGHCANTCPLNAIEIYKGLYAKVNIDKCVGCSKCAKVCPASVISIIERNTNNEK